MDGYFNNHISALYNVSYIFLKRRPHEQCGMWIYLNYNDQYWLQYFENFSLLLFFEFESEQNENSLTDSSHSLRFQIHKKEEFSEDTKKSHGKQNASKFQKYI